MGCPAYSVASRSPDRPRGRHDLGPDRLAERVNDFLHRSVAGKFVTAFLGFLDAATGRLVYANPRRRNQAPAHRLSPRNRLP